MVSPGWTLALLGPPLTAVARSHGELIVPCPVALPFGAAYQPARAVGSGSGRSVAAAVSAPAARPAMLPAARARCCEAARLPASSAIVMIRALNGRLLRCIPDTSPAERRPDLLLALGRAIHDVRKTAAD